MNRYKIVLKIGDTPFEFECWDDSKDFMKHMEYCYYISGLSKELPIEISEKKLIKEI
ncbi:hypothetical protein [Clostridium culturomicium]|uniref:hypothetical protein n=1 Tax=Clostridium culturomicium TaxID=1499683 RepID=UPI000AFE5EEE|nr:hypothetical protein [Clostridium culturomicium]